MQAWSFSSLTSFETCPRRHYLTKIAKVVREPESEQMRWGNEVHKALELRATTGKPLPTTMSKWDKPLQRILAAPGTLFAERKLALDKTLRPVDFFSPTAWTRGIVDLGKLYNDRALAIDWKTGKRKPGSEQLMLSAAMLMHHHPEVETVVTGFYWLPINKIDKATYTRADLPSIWDEFAPRVARLERAFATNQWEPTPSGLCRAWCPCTDCEFNGNKK